jgi:hypothetical protein
MAGTDCGKWFQAGLASSGMGTSPTQSLASFLTSTLPQVTGQGNFVGGTSNAIEGSSPLMPSGYLIAINNGGAFFNAIAAGQTLGASYDYASQFAAINGGSPQAQAFILLHEIAHLFGMIRPNDANSTANEAFNNDEIWLNCSGVIRSFSNQGHSDEHKARGCSPLDNFRLSRLVRRRARAPLGAGVHR